MKKTLLLCFIHGFKVCTSHTLPPPLATSSAVTVGVSHNTNFLKGGEDTFGVDYQFTKDLRDLVGQALPKVGVEVVVYPKYETRGDLGSCVSRFRDW
jgi:hypothetical protein